MPRRCRRDELPAREAVVRAESAAAWREIGLESLRAGEPEEALWFLRQAIEIDSDSPTAWQLLGRCFQEMGEEARARRCFTVACRQRLRSGLLEETRNDPLAPAAPPREPRDG